MESKCNNDVVSWGMNLGCNYNKLDSAYGLCKEVNLYRSGLCNKVVIKYIIEPKLLCSLGTKVVFVQKWSLKGGH